MPRTRPAPRVADGFAPNDWGLLIRLPAEVMIAAIAANGSGRRNVAEGLAGLDAIAAGRDSDSELVRAVVTAIYSEQQSYGRPGDPPPVGLTAMRPELLEQCERAAEILRTGADPGDASAYRQWVQHVAVRVSGASRSGGVLGLGGEPVDAFQQDLLDTLAAALS